MIQVALDRQIRPIYDAIDAGSNKSALQQCNKVLKKYPSSGLVKALKALAIVRMNKIEECLPLCDEILARKPTDLDVLNAMMHVLRALGRHTDLAIMYDEAYRAQPANEELGVQDFFANVRTGNWKTAQRIAQRLHKTFGGGGGGDRYLYWSVLGATLQANDSSTPPAMREVLQKLAQRLLDTVEVPPHATADRLHVHLSVLKLLGMFDEAAKLLETDEGKAVAKTSLIVDELRRDIVRARGDFEVEGARARARIVEDNDRNWLDFLAVLDATFVEPTESKVQDVRGIFRQLADMDGRRDRGPLLAVLEVERRAREKELSFNFESPNDLFNLIKLYFERFGDKACCFDDLKPYILLEGDELSELSTFLDAHEHTFDTEDAVRRSINVYMLRRYILTSSELDTEQEKARIFSYFRAYTAALLIGKKLPETELQPADDFVVLAVQTLVRLWKLESEESWLYMAASFLEYAVQRSKNSYLIRLHLVRVYRLLSAPSLALQHYRALHVKQVQNDTLSHYILARASTYSLAASGDLTLTQECVEASQIYAMNSSETSDFIVRAFATEKYSQVPELISFEDRLDNSLQRDLVKFEHVRMRLAHEGASPDLVDTELIELKFIFDRTHHDNRDFDIIPNYQPRSQPTFNELSLMQNTPGLGWLMTFLRIYIRVFLLASDIDETVEEKLLIGDRPKIADIPENKIPLKERIHIRKEVELSELTPDELNMFNYVSALCDWLAPYHNHVRPSPETVLAEAAKQQEQLRNSKNTSKASLALSNGSPSPPTNGQKKVTEEPPPVQDAPELVTGYFDAMAARFKEVTGSKNLPWEALHVATLTQEAVLMLALASMRFKAPAIVKANKFGALTTSLRALRQNAAAVLKGMANELSKKGAQESTIEKRRAFVHACKPIQEFPEFDNDSLLDVAKRIGDSRKRVVEGIGKGILKIAATQLQ